MFKDIRGKRVKHLLGVLISFILLVIPLYADDGGYSIEAYKVKIEVSEENIFNIREDIDVNFIAQRHGIYRKIPIKNRVTRIDGTVSQVIAKVWDVKSNIVSTYHTEGNDKVIKIGDPQVTVTGKQYYVLTYTYDLGKDVGKGYDEFYFNIIGNEWDTSISNVSFEIEMPKAFDANQIDFSVGAKGNTSHQGVYYEVEENRITGYYEGSLQSGEALTIRIELPEGYFTATRDNVSWSINLNILMIFPIVILIVVLLLWLIFARNPREKIEECTYLPEGLNSAEVGMIYKGKASNKDAISLLFSLAQKGYLKIIDKSDKDSRYKASNSFEIEKLKAYDGGDKAEAVFFKGLFNRRDRVDEEKLRDTFYKTVNKVKKLVNEKDKRAHLFKKGADRAKVLAIILAILSHVSVTYISFAYGGRLDIVFWAIICFTSGIIVLTTSISKEDLVQSIPFIIWGIIFMGLGGVILLWPLLRDYGELIPVTVMNQVCLVVMFKVIQKMIKRTPYGEKLYLEIKGFKKYIQNIDYRELKKLKEDHANYFEDMFAYMMALNISQKDMEKFNDYIESPPSWYEGKYSNSNGFINRLYRMMCSVEVTMSSNPSSSSGDSGGGSSGGGSGGGGGGSW